MLLDWIGCYKIGLNAIRLDATGLDWMLKDWIGC